MSGKERVALWNRHIQDMEEDVLYHLSLGSGSHDLKHMFGDIKYVCMGGTPHRMKEFAEYILKTLGYSLPTGTCLTDLSILSHRYAMYKVGPVLSISHGMGMPSASILLHEVIKLMYHAGVQDPIFFRIGTSGGIGLEPGTVVITEQAYDAQLRPLLETVILGNVVSRPAELDQDLADTLLNISSVERDGFKTVKGKTISTDDFYEGQERLDGAICEYTEQDKIQFLNKLSKLGIVNMEMEALVFAALTHKAGIRSAVLCVTLLDRLAGDQIRTHKEELLSWQERPQQLVAKFILENMSLQERINANPSLKLVRASSGLFAKSQSCFEDDK